MQPCRGGGMKCWSCAAGMQTRKHGVMESWSSGGALQARCGDLEAPCLDVEVSVTGGVLQACRYRGVGVLEARCRCADVEATTPELCVLGTLYAGGDAPCGGACV